MGEGLRQERPLASQHPPGRAMLQAGHPGPSYQDGCHLLVVLRDVRRPLLQAAQEESRVIAAAAGAGPAHGRQPVAPLVQRPDVGRAAQVPAQPQEAGRVLPHPAPPLPELGGGRQALGGQRRGRPAPRHQQQDPRLLEGLPESADAEGDFSRQLRARALPVGGEDRGAAAAGRRRLHGAQPAVRRGGQQPQPLGGEIRRFRQPSREHVGAGHEAAAGAPAQQQQLVVEGAERRARRPARRARRQQQRGRLPPVSQPRVHLGQAEGGGAAALPRRAGRHRRLRPRRSHCSRGAGLRRGRPAGGGTAPACLGPHQP